MRLLKNKKALDYGALMILVVAISSLYLSYSLLVKSADIQSPIGAFATGIYKTSQEADKILFYIQESAQLASQKAIYELASTAGFGETDCGKHGDYYLWNRNRELCAKNINENYLFFFNKNFNEYLKNYEGISAGNYDFVMEKNELHGIAVENSVLDILSSGNKVGKYSIKPSFKIKLKKDLSDYEKLENIARQILQNCASTDNTEECVKNNTKDLSFKKDGDVFLFEYDTNFKSKFGNLKIKFALSMPSVAPPEV